MLETGGLLELSLFRGWHWHKEDSPPYIILWGIILLALHVPLSYIIGKNWNCFQVNGLTGSETLELPLRGEGRQQGRGWRYISFLSSLLQEALVKGESMGNTKTG